MWANVLPWVAGQRSAAVKQILRAAAAGQFTAAFLREEAHHLWASELCAAAVVDLELANALEPPLGGELQ